LSRSGEAAAGAGPSRAKVLAGQPNPSPVTAIPG